MKVPIMIVCDIEVRASSAKNMSALAEKITKFLKDTCGTEYINCFRFEKNTSIEEINDFFSRSETEGLPIVDWHTGK